MFSDKSPNAELKLIDFGLSKVFFCAFPSFPPDPHSQPICPQRGRYSQLHRSRGVHARLPRLRLHQGLRHVVSRHHLLFPAHRPKSSSLPALHRSSPAALRQDPLSPEILEFHFFSSTPQSGSPVGFPRFFSCSIAGAGASLAPAAVSRGSEAVPRESRAEPAGVSGVQPAEEGGDDRGGVPSEQRGRSPRG